MLPKSGGSSHGGRSQVTGAPENPGGSAFHLGARFGQAGHVDHLTAGMIAASDTEGRFVLLDDGTVYSHHDIGG
jgi:hypothetical protein